MKHNSRTSRLLSLILPAIAIIAGSWGLPAKSSSEQNEIRRKARHFFLSGVKHEAEGNNAEAAELYRKAYETDSTYAEGALEYGIRRWGMPIGDLTTPEERAVSQRIARKFGEKYPGDFFPNLLYSNVMEQSQELEECIAVLERMRVHNPDNSDILQMLSGLYLDVDRPEDALDALDKYARIEGEDMAFYVRKAGMKLALKDTVGAIAEAQKLIDKYPKEAAGMAFKARLETYLERYDDALKSYQKAEEMSEPGSAGSIKMQMAEFYRMRGDSVNFDAKTYEALLEEDLDFATKKDVLALYLQGLLDTKGDWTRGDKLFGVLLKQYPYEPELLSLSARYNGVKKDYVKALEDMDYALDLDQTNEEYWEQALMYALMADDQERSNKYFQNSKKSLPRRSLTIYALAGSAELIGGSANKALEIYSEALSDYFPGQTPGEPLNLDVLNNTLTMEGVKQLATINQELGDVYFNLNDKEKAFQSYDNSIKLDNEVPLTLNNYAYFLVKDGRDLTEERLLKADEYSRRAISLAPDQPTYLDTRAWVLFRKGEYKEAKEIQLKALEMLGEDADEKANSEFYEHLGDILFMNHEPEEALSNWKRALKGDPDNELLQKKIKFKTFFFE